MKTIEFKCDRDLIHYCKEHGDHSGVYVPLADYERLRRILEPFTKLLQKHHENCKDDRVIFAINRAEITVGMLREARKALEGI
jgi:hypothetical protein